MKNQIRQIGICVGLLAALYTMALSSPIQTVGHAFVTGVGKIDNAAGKVVSHTARATKEAAHLTKRAVIDTGKGVGKGTEYVAKGTAHVATAGGRKVAHVFKRIV